MCEHLLPAQPTMTSAPVVCIYMCERVSMYVHFCIIRKVVPLHSVLVFANFLPIEGMYNLQTII